MQPRLVALAQSRLGNRAMAEDVVQDTWLKLEAADPEAPLRNAAGFMSQVTKNTICDHFRKERRRAEIDAQVQDLLWEQSNEMSPERVMIGRDTLRAVREALDELPEKTRRIFLMNRVGGMTHRRIAEQLDMSDEAVYYHIRRALEHLAHLRDDLRD